MASRSRCAVLVLGLLCTACFYDHRFTQAIQARNRRAKEAEGQKIGSEGAGARLPAKQVGRIRFYVADAYRRHHPGWQRQLEGLVEQASSVLRAGFGTALEVSELHAWAPACEDARIAECLHELAAFETEGEQEWVVGVLPAEPRFVTQFDELGMAHVPGRHFILRDVSDAAEREQIAKAFASHSQARRDEIHKKRTEHKRLAVFLHEWGHTMGAMHRKDQGSLMHGAYDDAMADFDSDNTALIAASLRDAFGEGGHAELRAALDNADADGCPKGARDDLIARLDAPPAAENTPAAAESSAPKRHPYVVYGDEASVLAGVSDADRPAYRNAVGLVERGDYAGSLKALEPLVDRYPKNYAVQHLACGLTMELGYGASMQELCLRAQTLVRVPGEST